MDGKWGWGVHAVVQGEPFVRMECFLEKGHYPSWGVHRQMAPERLQMASSPGRCGLQGTSVINVEPFPSPMPSP